MSSLADQLIDALLETRFPDQRSTTDQLTDLKKLAIKHGARSHVDLYHLTNKHGLYDASDYVMKFPERFKKGFSND